MPSQSATGALIGLALGDALGYPTEFDSVAVIEEKYGPWRWLDLATPALVSDDTQMTLAVARGLRTAGGRGSLAPMRLARPVREEFLEWARSPENNRMPGHTCLVACGFLSQEELPWQDASQMDSKGCGANMRVAPVGLFPGLNDGQRAGAAQLQAALTHGHPTGLAAADLTARAVYLLAQGARPTELVALLRAYAEENRRTYHEHWLGDLWRRTGAGSGEDYIERGWVECGQALDRLDVALRERDSGGGGAADPEVDPCLFTGEGWVAEEALATGLLCFLLFPGEPVAALRRAACSSGDSDSIACLTGAFAGAYLGAEAWPREWAERIEYGEELRELGALWDGA